MHALTKEQLSQNCSRWKEAPTDSLDEIRVKTGQRRRPTAIRKFADEYCSAAILAFLRDGCGKTGPTGGGDREWGKRSWAGSVVM